MSPVVDAGASLWPSLAPLKIHPDLHVWHPTHPNANDINGVFAEVLISLKTAFRRLGMDIPIVKGPYPANDRALIVSGLLIENLQRILRRPKLDIPENAIVYNHEQIYDGAKVLSKNYTELMKSNEVWDYSVENIVALNKMGINARHVPVGYVPDLERYHPKEKQDIDVLFVGAMNERRQKILKDISSRGLRVHHGIGVYGEERDELHARSKIVLNIHYYPSMIFETVRVSYLLANGSFVVSEDGQDKKSEKSYEKGVVFGAAKDLPDLCVKYINDPESRAEVSAEGQRIMRSMKFENFIEKALRQPGSRAVMNP